VGPKTRGSQTKRHAGRWWSSAYVLRRCETSVTEDTQAPPEVKHRDAAGGGSAGVSTCAGGSAGGRLAHISSIDVEVLKNTRVHSCKPRVVCAAGTMEHQCFRVMPTERRHHAWPVTPRRQLSLGNEASATGAHTLIVSSRSRTCPRARSGTGIGIPVRQNPWGGLGAPPRSADHAFVFFSAISAPNGLRIRLQRRACARSERRGQERDRTSSCGGLGGRRQATSGQHCCSCASTSTGKSAWPAAAGCCGTACCCPSLGARCRRRVPANVQVYLRAL
jgi:hypothetical protein